MISRERLMISQRFRVMQDMAKKDEIAALEAMAKAVLASDDPASFSWAIEAQDANVAAAVYRALIDAEAIAVGDSIAIPSAEAA